MIQHYFKMALRNILKRKTQTIVCILGVAAGILCFSVCSYYVQAEYRGDSEFPRYNEMAILRGVQYSDNDVYADAKGYGIQNLFAEQFAEDIELTAIMQYLPQEDNMIVESNGTERKVRILSQACNGDFVAVYPPKLVMGSIEEFRRHPNSAIITEELSKKLFGNESPLGKTILTESDASKNTYASVATLTVTGVMKPYLPFTFNNALSPEMLHHYTTPGILDIYTYILKPEADINHLNSRLSKIEFRNGVKTELLYKHKIREVNYVALFISFIGFLVLSSGLMNFLSTSIGSFVNRTEELSLRKILGALRRQQFLMLLMELLLVLGTSFFLCLILTETLLSYMIKSMSAEFSRAFFINIRELFGQQFLYFFYILLFCSIITFIGVFRIKDKQRISKHRIRNILLCVQFFICMVFILATGATYLSAKNTLKNNAPYLNEADMKHILSIHLDNERDILKKHLPEIIQFIKSSSLYDKFTFISETPPIVYDKLKKNERFTIKYVSPEYMEIMKFPLNKQLNEDEPCCFVSETLNEILKINSTDFIQIGGKTYPVAQVVKSDLSKWSTRNIAYIPTTDISISEQIYIRAKEGKSREAMSALHEKIQSYLPEYNNFKIYSLKKDKKSEMQEVAQGLFMICSVICIMITILGLYGAITIDTERKQKEIAIRKINGAGIKHIYWLFGKSYLWLFLTSTIIAFTLMLFIMTFLSSGAREYFDYTNPLYWILSFSLVAIVIVCTVSYRIYKISRINPAEIIKSE